MQPLTTVIDARTRFEAHRAFLEQRGIVMDGVQSYLPEAFRNNVGLAMDAMPTSTLDANAGVMALLTTYVDPDVINILFAPNKAVDIMGEKKKGDWTTDQAAFPVVEQLGEVSTYGDWNSNGRAGINANWPQFQCYNYQFIMEYGDREMARYGLAKLNYVSEIEKAGSTIFNKFTNFVYFFGIAGLQNYGLINNPYLSAPMQPSIKANGGLTPWYNSSGIIVANANEIFADIQSLFTSLVVQTAGIVDRQTTMVLACSPQSEAAFTTTNAFGNSVSKMVKDNFPNISVISAVQYQSQSASNPQGVAGGNFMQLIAKSLEGQDTGYCSFNEKMRTGPVIRDLSSYRQKAMGGAWGTILRMPVAITSMIGV